MKSQQFQYIVNIATFRLLEFIAFPYGEKADHPKARFTDPEAEKGPVITASYEANGYGLYDMSGNVWEWVSDCRPHILLRIT